MKKIEKREPTLVQMKVSDSYKREAVRHCLNGVCVDYSITSPSNSIMDRLVTFLIESYPTIRISEITKAFDMNASGNYWPQIQTFGKLDKMILGNVIAKYLSWRRDQYRQKGSGNYNSGKKWTPKDSYDEVMNYKSKYEKLPDNVGVYLWAYKHACESGIMKFDQKEWKEALNWSRKNIDRIRKPPKGKEIAMMVIKTKPDDDLKYLAAKQLFIKHHEKTS